MCSALRQVDSGFFCEGYSSDEDVLIKEEFRGNVIKQGCLLKQVGKMFLCSLLQLCCSITYVDTEVHRSRGESIREIQLSPRVTGGVSSKCHCMASCNAFRYLYVVI